ncbi:MAG TPA: hypothetical protein VKH37_10865, partial [Ferruginibacter sp.]|nr:hypothetical protein [Ferruginibacter sp.]
MDNTKLHRRKILGWGLGIVGTVFGLNYFSRSSKKNVAPVKTAKMLTEHGRLVEIDINAIPTQKKKISNKE